MKKVGVSTVFTGFNYGSSLQAYATKVILKNNGFEGIILGQKGSLIKGRDVRIKKLCSMFFRALIHPKARKTIKAYKENPTAVPTEETKILFRDFTERYIRPDYRTWRELKKIGKSSDYIGFLCGSDQIWNGDTLYVDPFYYLRYAPVEKRIAFSPSFGRDKISDYNIRLIKKYISDFNYLSVREESGVEIVKRLTNQNAIHLLDPTLMISSKQWDKELEIKTYNNDDLYILAYFLNEPSENAQKTLRNLSKSINAKILAIPYRKEKKKWFDYTINVGPKEFVENVKNTSFICTDSFHGTAFAINYHIPFYTFERQYGSAGKQSARVISLLEKLSLMERFNPIDCMDEKIVDYEKCEEVLQMERKKAINYLNNALNNK